MYESIIDFSLLRAFFSSSYMLCSVPPAILIPTHTKHTADLHSCMQPNANTCKHAHVSDPGPVRTCHSCGMQQEAQPREKLFIQSPFTPPPPTHALKNTQKNNFSGMQLHAAERGIHCVHKNTTLGRSHTQTDTQFMTDC